MKRIFTAVFLLQLIVIGYWGLASQKWSLAEAVNVDPESGIIVKQDTPENTIYSYYELLSRKEYEKVRMLTTPASRKAVDVKTMTQMISKTRMENAVLEKVFPAGIDGDLAVVGYIRSATIEKKVFMVGLAVFKINNNQWEKMESANELKLDQLEKVIKMAVKVEENMLATKATDYDITNFTNREQVQMITSQVTAMLENHKQSLVQLQDMKKQQKEAIPQNSTKK